MLQDKDKEIARLHNVIATYQANFNDVALKLISAHELILQLTTKVTDPSLVGVKYAQS